MPVTVRNNEPGPTVFSDRSTDTMIEWAGAGDPKGEDVQQVPDALLEHPGMAKALRAGTLSIEGGLSADESEQMLTSSVQAAREARQTQEAEVLKALEVTSTDNDFITVKCLISGEDLVMRAGDLFDRPPLAPRFAERAHEFEAVPTGKTLADGRPEVTWVKAQAAAGDGAAPTS